MFEVDLQYWYVVCDACLLVNLKDKNLNLGWHVSNQAIVCRVEICVDTCEVPVQGVSFGLKLGQIGTK